ncbi:MAG TPA: ergothioneine biosynthesis protein EgtB [Candidatus Limnocylindria bacterium]|nr:ergothioneine biosynthesis protein EgtB [Candidatus Limnocylindria bacterium]
MREAFLQSVVRGLSDTPRWLSCRYLYDERGSTLFEAITEVPEYYPTRVEDALLARHAARIRALAGDTTLVELGSGSSTKTRRLLAAWTAAAARARYVAIDISETMLARSCAALAAEFPTLTVERLAGTYEQTLPRLAAFSPLTLLFLGSSLGNFDRRETIEFLDRVRAALAPGDHFLIGLDLVKDPRILEAAYDDAAGVTAAFTRNLFARMNRELGTRLDLDAIEHVAIWNERRERIEIFARFPRGADVELPAVGRRFRIGRGEMILIEVSRKFRLDELRATAQRHALAVTETFVDAAMPFALVLLRRRADARRPSPRLHAERLLTAVRAQTLELTAPLDDAALTRQQSPLMSPIVWDLGHIANFEEQWIRRAHAPHSRRDDAARQRDALYDAVAHPRSRRGRLALLSPDACRRYLDAVRAETLAVLRAAELPDDDPLLAGGFVHAMLAQHEAQHSETILQTVQLIDDLVYEPARRREPRAALVPAPAGTFVMGTDDRQLAYDNERPAHEAWVDRFQIDLHPVTNGQYLRFVEDGGYRRPELWDDAGRRWLADSGAEHPAGWLRGRDGWEERHFGRRLPLILDQPVVHVCWFEASAYARWAGKRLPSEAEWEKAAAWDLERGTARAYPWGDAPPTAEHANLDQWTFAPAAVGAYPEGASFFGCHQMLGDVWEWTADDFAPYPGFEVFPYAEYSAIHFGKGYKVLRGGSWATHALVARPTFRNWDLPERRQIFAGFRCAADG